MRERLALCLLRRRFVVARKTSDPVKVRQYARCAIRRDEDEERTVAVTVRCRFMVARQASVS